MLAGWPGGRGEPSHTVSWKQCRRNYKTMEINEKHIIEGALCLDLSPTILAGGV